jgi:hypothetical protein
MLLAIFAAAAISATPDPAQPIFFKCRLAEHVKMAHEAVRPIGNFDRFLKVEPNDIRIWSDTRHQWGENWCDHGARCEITADAVQVRGGYGDLSLSRTAGTFSSLIRGNIVTVTAEGTCSEGPDLHK